MDSYCFGQAEHAFICFSLTQKFSKTRQRNEHQNEQPPQHIDTIQPKWRMLTVTNTTKHIFFRNFSSAYAACCSNGLPLPLRVQIFTVVSANEVQWSTKWRFYDGVRDTYTGAKRYFSVEIVNKKLLTNGKKKSQFNPHLVCKCILYEIIPNLITPTFLELRAIPLRSGFQVRGYLLRFFFSLFGWQLLLITNNLDCNVLNVMCGTVLCFYVCGRLRLCIIHVFYVAPHFFSLLCSTHEVFVALVSLWTEWDPKNTN